MRAIAPASLVAILGACLLGAAPIAAQSLNLGRSGGQPIEIEARDGIEWHRDTQRYVARGEARAVQGATIVEANVLTAYYRDKRDGGTEIFRYEGDGRVRITTPTQSAVGDRAVYDIDSGVLVMTGRNLKLTTPNETITARDSLEYWEEKRLAVARGEALAIAKDKRLKGDVLAAYFVDSGAPPAATTGRAAGAARPQPAQESGERARLDRIEAFGNVHVSTPGEIVRGDRGVYNPGTAIATLAGNVRITRGKNQLNGDYAEVNLNSGVSRLLSRPKPGETGRVRGLFVPEKKDGAPDSVPPGKTAR